MVSGIQGPSDGSDPTQSSGGAPQFQTGMGAMYTGAKAPGFQEWMQQWFGPSVSPEMVSAFEQNMMQMIQTSMKRSQAQHKKVQEEVKQRINE